MKYLFCFKDDEPLTEPVNIKNIEEEIEKEKEKILLLQQKIQAKNSIDET